MRYGLLSTNAKLEKLNGVNFLLAGLSLAPHQLGQRGNVCEHATPGCKSACVLWFTGRTVMEQTRSAMRRRTQLFFDDRLSFDNQLRSDIARHISRANQHRLKPILRLNVASDLDWSHIAAEFPDCQFYDYTKVRSRLRRTNWPDNYQLTFSLSERTHWRTTRSILERKKNVAAVFSTRYHPQSGLIEALPETYSIGRRQYQVIDGDRHDVRLKENDGYGVIVGLRFKGSLKRREQSINNGFCINVN